MNKIKNLLTIVLFALVAVLPLSTVKATDAQAVFDNPNKPYLALGADLTAEQRATVLSLMGLSEADLADYKVLTITNAMEHQYLDQYVGKSVIGTRALSSVMIKQAEPGHGIVVTTKNITYCTTGMYRNALLTAGVTDADVMVVGPTQISGTAAVIGALKAYEEMSGTAVSDQTLDTALNEIVTTGELVSENSADAESIEALVAFIKQQIAEGKLKTEADVRNAIKEGEEKFGVSFSTDEIQRIVDIMKKIDKLGIDPTLLLDHAKDIYGKYGADLFTNPDKALGDIVVGAVKEFFSKIGNGISGFFKNLFS